MHKSLVAIDPVVQSMIQKLDTNLLEHFEERAAVIEFDAGVSRAHAECLALLDVIQRFPQSVLGISAFQFELDEEQQWLVTTDLGFARRYLAKMGAIETEAVDLADVLDSQYGSTAFLTPRR